MEIINKLVIEEDKRKINGNHNATDNRFNVLITNVSVAKVRDGKIDKNRYIDEYGNIFCGGMTNEAPIKSIAHRLGKQGEYLDAILFIESNKTQTDTFELEGKKYSHIDYLKQAVKNFLGKHVEKTMFIDEKIADEPTENDVSETIFRIYEHLIQWASDNKNLNIYIESNGGVRYVLIMLLSLTKTLENYYENVHISEITSMIFQEQPIQIINKKEVFDTAQITGIADEFVNYGRTNSLWRYYDDYKYELNEEQSKDVETVLLKLRKLSEDIQLCRTSMMLDDLYGESNLRDIIGNFTKKYKDDDGALISILRHIFQLILGEMNKTVYCSIENDNHNAPIIFLPDTIEWCINKSYIQQALTFCSEQLANYLIESGKMHLSNGIQTYLNSKDTKAYDKNYYFLANFTEFENEINKSKVNGIMEIIKSKDIMKMLGSEEWEIDECDLSSELDDFNTEEIGEIVERIQNVMETCYGKENKLSGKFLKKAFSKNGFDMSILDKSVHLSQKNNKVPLRCVMRGNYKKDEKEIPHPELKEKSKRIKKILPVIIDFALNECQKKQKEDSEQFYNKMIRELFNESDEAFVNALIEEYSVKQSAKYNLKNALELKHITSNQNDEAIQRIVYLYSICKEQRNCTNHANDSKNTAMNIDQLTIVMQSLIETLRTTDHKIS